MKKPLPRISDAEWKVMEILWDRSPLTAADVIATLPPAKKWSGNTVRTLLSRLVKKGAAAMEKDGVRFLYRSKFERDRYVHEESASFLDRVFLGSAKPLLLHFAESSRLSPEDIEDLKRCLGKGDKK